MGTRGAYGFRKNDQDKVTYNHWDSYPSGLGADVVEFIQGSSIDEMNQLADKIKLVDGRSTPTEEDLELCKDVTNLSVSNGSTEDWYCVLRETQGNLDILREIPLMIDSHTFLVDSLFCEWAYIINLDENVLEIYRGFNKEPSDKGRYASLKEPDRVLDNGNIIKTKHYGVELIKEIPLSEIISDGFDMGALEKEVYAEDEE
jgi:hypothetical protein